MALLPFANGLNLPVLDARYVKKSGDTMTGQLVLSLAGTGLSVTQDAVMGGYLRVGSTSAPANTTAGDLTGTRATFGDNSALGTGNTNAEISKFVGSTTDTSNIVNGVYFSMTANPSGASSSQPRSFYSTLIIDSSNTQNNTSGTGPIAYRADTQHLGSGNITHLSASYFTNFFGSNFSSGSSSTVTNAYGIQIYPINNTGSPTGTVSNAFGIKIQNSNVGAGPLVITNHYAIDIAAQTRASSLNVGLRIAAPSGASSNYALQLSDTGGTASGGLTFATDVQLYRSAANTLNLASGDSLTITAANLITDTTTGMKIGTGTTQKIAFYNSTPIVQPSGTGETTGFTAGAGTNVTDASTFTGNVGSTAYRISDVVKALKNLGLLAA